MNPYGQIFFWSYGPDGMFTGWAMFAIVGIFREHPEANMDRKDFVSKKQAARVLGVAFRTVDRICEKNQVRVWQLPNHSRRLYNKADLMAMLSVADLGAAVSAASV